MEAIIVPCTHEKIWDSNPQRGPTLAKDAYTKECFSEWRRIAEASGGPWFVLSTKHGLLRPDDLVDGPYNVPISVAIRDASLLSRLRAQGIAIGFSQFERVVLLDWERFQPLVRASVGDKVPCVLRKVVFS